MAIKLEDQSVAFYEIFKTGTTFVREALNAANIKYKNMIPLSHFQKDILKKPDYEKCGYYRHSPWWAYKYVQTKYCIVRHPIPWYESVWKFFKDFKSCNVQLSYWQRLTITGKQPTTLDDSEKVIEPDFNDFIQRIIEKHPAIYTSMVEQFVGSDYSLMNKVIKTETLNQDLYKILVKLGYPKNLIQEIKLMPKIFASKNANIEWNPKHKEKILYLEQEIIKRYYNE